MVHSIDRGTNYLERIPNMVAKNFLKVAAIFCIAHPVLSCKRQAPASNLKEIPQIAPPAVHRCSIPSTSRGTALDWTVDEALQNVLSPEDKGKIPSDIVYTTSVASEISYQPRDQVSTVLNKLGYTNVEIMVEGNIFGYFAFNSTKNCAIIAFRGTNELKDWFTNTHMTGRVLTRDGRLSAHSGFYNAMVSLRDRAYLHLRNYTDANTTIWVTGHSLGGAIAGLFAYDTLVYNAAYSARPRIKKYYIDKLVTFGQPYFANDQLAKYMDSQFRGKYLRVVNENDIVTKLPPTGYYHAGQLVWLHNKRLSIFAGLFGLESGLALSQDQNVASTSQKQEDIKAFNEFMNSTFDTTMQSDSYVVGADGSAVGAGPVPETGEIQPQSVSMVPSNFENHRNRYYLEIAYQAFFESQN